MKVTREGRKTISVPRWPALDAPTSASGASGTPSLKRMKYSLPSRQMVPGNWVGEATSYDDTWPSGFSKAWGKNVGNQELISCISVALYTTNGALPNYGCQVSRPAR